LPAIGRTSIRRAANKLPENGRSETRDKWLETAAKLSGGNLTKLLWGFTCLLMASQLKKGSVRIMHLIFFAVFVRLTARDFISLRFAGPRQLRARWLILQAIADQALVANDPNARQPLLDLAETVAEKTQDEEAMRRINAIRNSLAASDPRSTPGTMNGNGE
jgi:hypothetical protein